MGFSATLLLPHICFHISFFCAPLPPSIFLSFLYETEFRVRLAPVPIVMLEHPVAHGVLRHVSAFPTLSATPTAFPHSPILPRGSHSDASVSDLEILQSSFLCTAPEWDTLWLNAKAKLRRNTGDN